MQLCYKDLSHSSLATCILLAGQTQHFSDVKIPCQSGKRYSLLLKDSLGGRRSLKTLQASINSDPKHSPPNRCTVLHAGVTLSAT